jgi:hypothetical protein
MGFLSERISPADSERTRRRGDKKIVGKSGATQIQAVAEDLAIKKIVDPSSHEDFVSGPIERRVDFRIAALFELRIVLPSPRRVNAIKR